MMDNIPTLIELHPETADVKICFASGDEFRLPCEYLRVFSPSAEVRGHGLGEGELVSGKRHVNIKAIDSVGNYAIKIHFDDGHNSGIYSWNLLYDLGINHERHWQQYLDKLKEAGRSRDPVKS